MPLLVLANKNDLPGALSVDDMIREMRLGEIGGRVVSVSRGALGVVTDHNSVIRPVTRRNIISISSSSGLHSGRTSPKRSCNSSICIHVLPVKYR